MVLVKIHILNKATKTSDIKEGQEDKTFAVFPYSDRNDILQGIFTTYMILSLGHLYK